MRYALLHHNSKVCSASPHSAGAVYQLFPGHGSHCSRQPVHLEYGPVSSVSEDHASDQPYQCLLQIPDIPESLLTTATPHE